MERGVKSVIPIIESNYEKFTTVEKNIADFFMENKKKINFSAKAVAEKLYISEASLSRFAKKCGYRGYREFIYQYEESFVEKQESIAGNTLIVLNAYQELLNKTYSLFDEAQLNRICNYLNGAEKILVCGKGSSGFAASEMENRFMRVGVDIDSVRDSDLIRMRAVFQSEKSLVIGISISGSQEDIQYLLRKAHQRGAKTVLFTANNQDEYAEYCTEVVLLPSRKHLNHGNVISPQFPILIMIDILYSYYVEQDKYKKEVLHDNTLWALEEGKAKRRRIVD